MESSASTANSGFEPDGKAHKESKFWEFTLTSVWWGALVSLLLSLFAMGAKNSVVYRQKDNSSVGTSKSDSVLIYWLGDAALKTATVDFGVEPPLAIASAKLTKIEKWTSLLPSTPRRELAEADEITSADNSSIEYRFEELSPNFIYQLDLLVTNATSLLVNYGSLQIRNSNGLRIEQQANLLDLIRFYRSEIRILALFVVVMVIPILYFLRKKTKEPYNES